MSALLILGTVLLVPGRSWANRPDVEIGILKLIRDDPNQWRSQVKLDVCLTRAAQWRAQDMIARNYFSHTTPDGQGPNAIAKAYGYALPSYYDHSASGNNIESIYYEYGYGYPDAWRVFYDWITSSSHKTHVLGQDYFYMGQTSVGVGVYSDGYQTACVFLSAHPNATDTWSAFISYSFDAYDYHADYGYEEYGLCLFYYYNQWGMTNYYGARESYSAAYSHYYNMLAFHWYYYYAAFGDYTQALTYYYYYAYYGSYATAVSG